MFAGFSRRLVNHSRLQSLPKLQLHVNPRCVFPSSLLSHRDDSAATTRSFASGKKKKKKKGGRQKTPLDHRTKKLLAYRGLHKAAKWKRILSQCDYWFSRANLKTDDFVQDTLMQYNGWMPLEILLTFPKFQYWVNSELLVGAFLSTGGRGRYELSVNADQKQQDDDGDSSENELNGDIDPEDEESIRNLAKKDVWMRHRRVTLNSLDALNQEEEESEEEEENDETTIAATPKKKKGTSHLPVYKCDRKIRLFQGWGRPLADFLKRLTKEAVASDSPAVGFDVEFCTLELDISSTLPAMLQLASKDEVGLIWLDKFPDRGRDLLLEPDSREPGHQQLLSLLGDGSILKVGVGARRDALHLAKWWGITDRKYVRSFLDGMTNLEEDPNSPDHDGSLETLCADLLQFRLKKVKYAGGKRKKQGKGAPHKKTYWRAPQITAEMEDYAANDAACAYDIWQVLRSRDIEQDDEASVQDNSAQPC